MPSSSPQVPEAGENRIETGGLRIKISRALGRWAGVIRAFVAIGFLCSAVYGSIQFTKGEFEFGFDVLPGPGWFLLWGVAGFALTVLSGVVAALVSQLIISVTFVSFLVIGWNVFGVLVILVGFVVWYGVLVKVHDLGASVSEESERNTESDLS